jgi:hypothetical protein
MVLSTIFQLCRGSQFYWWKTSEYLEKTSDLPQVTDKLSTFLGMEGVIVVVMAW